ncbi:RICIN domain-containing protein [Streptomyces sp. NPDC090088]|uniref:RICIN domain-containing protein n=1 Tax=Streptomyces sp. NPDC090088 TaxID=3365944 RepID=UPI003826871D
MRKRLFSLLAASCAAVPILLAGASPASADTSVNQDLVNKMDGSRLALGNDSTADGAEAITLRGTRWDSYITEAWDFDGTYDSNSKLWTATLRNRASNRCLEPEAANPVRGNRVVVRSCDGSDRQKWSLRLETGGGNTERWWMWRPVSNLNVAMALQNTNNDQWDSVRLDYSYPSTDRLWLLGPNNSAWW